MKFLTGIDMLEDTYNSFLYKYGFEFSDCAVDISSEIKGILNVFMCRCKVPAIWCNGKHTRMLLADYIFELKKVNYIIDENIPDTEDSGYVYLSGTEIDEYKIDGIVISTYDYRNIIKEIIRDKYPHIAYLDIYEELEKRGIFLAKAYFAGSHPYCQYEELNHYCKVFSDNNNEANLMKLIRKSLEIKDFQLAMDFLKEYGEKAKIDWHEMHEDLENLYDLEMETIRLSSEQNVFMICIDGLRRQDVLSGEMPDLQKYLENRTHFFVNAYSTSTSTFESLVPTYSENNDLRTKYYNDIVVPTGKCRLINLAKEKGMNIRFYTDSCDFVNERDVEYSPGYQSACEKIWNLAINLEKDKHSLQYIHFLYESHFSYPNPYDGVDMISDGSNILFDYLNTKGGKLRTDYDKQHRNSLKYLDERLVDMLEMIPGNMVFYADHGNIILNKEEGLNQVTYPMVTFSEDLIQIPFAIKQRGLKACTDSRLISLMELNEIVCNLMTNCCYNLPVRDYIKVVRSAIYNADFRFLYEKMGYSKGLQAFEAFIFSEGYKLIVYEDSCDELYDMNDEIIEDVELLVKLKNRVTSDVTVKV